MIAGCGRFAWGGLSAGVIRSILCEIAAACAVAATGVRPPVVVSEVCMAAAIEEAQVRHIAKLARLELTNDEVRLFAQQLGDVLEYMHTLDAVDVAGVEPLAHPLPLSDVLREDVPHTSIGSALALANAPEREGPYFKVPAVLDAESN